MLERGLFERVHFLEMPEHLGILEIGFQEHWSLALGMEFEEGDATKQKSVKKSVFSRAFNEERFW